MYVATDDAAEKSPRRSIETKIFKIDKLADREDALVLAYVFRKPTCNSCWDNRCDGDMQRRNGWRCKQVMIGRTAAAAPQTKTIEGSGTAAR
jgi:hypothetical protein